jgi:4-amino-4-deoxy-L-arabinose transferase-like glycosyltransferase
VVLLAAFGLRLYRLNGPSLWYDELLELDIVQGSFSRIWPELPRHSAMPLDYYLLHGWVKLGRQEAWVRFPALFWGVLAVPLTYAAAARLFNRRVGALSLLLIAVAPLAVRYSQEARPYSLLLCCTAGAYWAVWRAYLTGKARHWGWAGLGLALAVFTHYFALFLFAPVGLLVLSRLVSHRFSRQSRRQLAYFGLIVLVSLGLLTGAGRFWQLYSVGVGFAKTAGQPSLLTLSPDQKPNRGAGPPLELAFVRENMLKPLSTYNVNGLTPFNLFFIAAVISLVWPRPARQARAPVLFLLAWLVIPPIFIYLFLLQRGTFFAGRYILFTLPAYLILVAYGSTRLAAALAGASRSRLFWATAGVLLGFTLILRGQTKELRLYYQPGSREDWRAVGQLLQQNAAPNDAVIAVRAEPAINWYYPPGAAPFGFYHADENIQQAVNTHTRHWFVLSSYSARRDSAWRDWLAGRPAVRLAIDNRIELFFHQDGLSMPQLLALAQTFPLPPNAITHAIMADQFVHAGEVQTGRQYLRQALALAQTPAEQTLYRERLAALPAP